LNVKVKYLLNCKNW